MIFLPGGWFNIKMPSYQYRKSHCGDKTILRPFYLRMGFLIQVRWHIYIESGPKSCNYGICCFKYIGINPSSAYNWQQSTIISVVYIITSLTMSVGKCCKFDMYIIWFSLFESYWSHATWWKYDLNNTMLYNTSYIFQNTIFKVWLINSFEGSILIVLHQTNQNWYPKGQ